MLSAFIIRLPLFSSLFFFFSLPIIVCESLQWQSLPFSSSFSYPLPREYASFTRLVGTNEYYLIAGKDSSGNHYNDVYRSTDQFYSFTQVTNTAPFPATSSACAASIRSADNVPYLLLYGGYLNNHAWYSTDRGAHWNEGPYIGFGSNNNVLWPMCVNSNEEKELIIIGGCTVWGGDYSNMIYRLSVSTDNSIQITQSTVAPFAARAAGAIASSGSFVFIAGGYTGTEYLNDVWFSSDNAYTWARMSDQSDWQARDGLSGWMIYGVMYIAAGHAGQYYMNDVWKSTDGGVHWSLVSDYAPWSAVEVPLVASDLNVSTIYIGGGSTGNTPVNSNFYSAIPSLPSCGTDQIWDYSTVNRQFQCISISDPSVYPNPQPWPTNTPPASTTTIIPPSTTVTTSTSTSTTSSSTSSSPASCSPSDWPDWIPVNSACRCASVWTYAGQTFCDGQCANPAGSMPKPFCITEEPCNGFSYVYCGPPTTTTSAPDTSSTLPTTIPSPSPSSSTSSSALPADFSARMGVLIPSLIIQLLCGGYALFIYRRVIDYSKYHSPSPSQDPLIVRTLTHSSVVNKKAKVIMLIAFIIAPIFIMIGYFQHYIRYSCLLFAVINCIRVFLLYRYVKKCALFALFEQVSQRSNQQSGMASNQPHPSMINNHANININDSHSNTSNSTGYVRLDTQTNNDHYHYHLQQDHANV